MIKDTDNIADQIFDSLLHTPYFTSEIECRVYPVDNSFIGQDELDRLNNINIFLIAMFDRTKSHLIDLQLAYTINGNQISIATVNSLQYDKNEFITQRLSVFKKNGRTSKKEKPQPQN